MLTIKPQQDQSPIIVDDSCDLPFDLEETVASLCSDYYEGLLAKADVGAAAQLSMSSYEKSEISNLNGTFSCGSKMLLLCFCHRDGLHTVRGRD